MEQIIIELLTIQNQFRIFHWQTKSFSRHSAFGMVYDSLDDLIDTFVETMQSSGERISVNSKIEIRTINDKEIVSFLKNFVDYLKKMNTKRTDLLAIRDDMLIDVNQTIYLFSFE